MCASPTASRASMRRSSTRLALATFLGWMLSRRGAWHDALLHAVAVLIITCPCALGLAVPAVQVVATRPAAPPRHDGQVGAALERLAEVDTVVFDKTGTLTVGRPASITGCLPPGALRAGGIARWRQPPSAGPALAALRRAWPSPTGVEEIAGQGLRLAAPRRRGPARQPRAGAASPEAMAAPRGPSCGGAARPAPACFAFTDPLRPDAGEVIGALERRGLGIELVSGDRPPIGRAGGRQAWIEPGASPAAGGKAARWQALAAAGRHVLMVGDGLNDAPALAAAPVSMSPSAASTSARTPPTPCSRASAWRRCVEVLRCRAPRHRLIRQNFWAWRSPTMSRPCRSPCRLGDAAGRCLRMSSSSLIVIGNALRLRGAVMSGLLFLIPRSGAWPAGPRRLSLGAAQWSVRRSRRRRRAHPV